jgi:hypothetical protein
MMMQSSVSARQLRACGARGLHCSGRLPPGWMIFLVSGCLWTYVAGTGRRIDAGKTGVQCEGWLVVADGNSLPAECYSSAQDVFRLEEVAAPRRTAHAMRGRYFIDLKPGRSDRRRLQICSSHYHDAADQNLILNEWNILTRQVA